MTDHAMSPERECLSQLSDAQIRALFRLAQNVSVAHSSSSIKQTSTAMEKLDELVGLESAKTTIKQIIAFHKVKAQASLYGKSLGGFSSHMCFCGNPGTAKTTLARLFGEILWEAKISNKKSFVETGRTDLVGKFAGYTPKMVQKKFREARGGILFIDEAYSLLDDRQGGYGDEAINTIVQEMENHRDDVIVIFAGYPDRMKDFIANNPGLRSRIPFIVNFPDYTAEELYRIAQIHAAGSGFSLAPNTHKKLISIFNDAFAHGKDFGNGRFARTLVEQAELNWAAAMDSKGISDFSRESVFTLQPENFSSVNGIKFETPEKRIGFSV